jgi:hypothetical protein
LLTLLFAADALMPHEHTRPIFKTLLKFLASAGPSIHGAFDKPILHRLAGCDV